MRQASCEKLHFDEHKAFGSLCFLEQHLTVAQLEKSSRPALRGPGLRAGAPGERFCVHEDGQWYELNATAAGLTAAPIPQGSRCSSSSARGLDKAGWKKT